jgi:hypothetical protein
MFIISHFIVHKVTSEVNTLTEDNRTLKLAAMSGNLVDRRFLNKYVEGQISNSESKSKSSKK